MLEIENLSAAYGPKHVLFNIDLKVPAGDIVVVVGPNGAGKSTLLNAVTGLGQITSGRVVFNGQDVNRLRPDQVVRHGLALCPEGRQILQRLTVEENLIAGHVGRTDKSFETLRAEVFELFPVLKERRNSPANRMSGGQHQMLAIGRALMAEPSLLMLDEPSLGLAPKIITQIFHIILDLANSGIAILLVEQNARLAIEIADYVHVLEGGRCALHGEPEEISGRPELMHLYFAGAGEH
ncbi:ABC transporter ATP-binding protein [Pseudomonas cavernae]|uniref:ABC transporter ATP-binding protein n=1 Tax=Pseudomonas cavernae TaxID=2320867 RepID=A0A385ZAP7_9PSED|nr:ABC transporter ATP-binding protein [Pseudomonas cavernae]